MGLETLRYKLKCLKSECRHRLNPGYIMEEFKLPWDLLNNVVLDIETTGLDPSLDELVSAGLAIRDRAVIMLKINMPDGRFRSLVRRLVITLQGLGYTIWAWNCRFEEKFLDLVGLSELQIKQFERKDASVRIEMPYPIISGREVPLYWVKWKNELLIEPLIAIRNRNLYCLLTETMSLVRKLITI